MTDAGAGFALTHAYETERLRLRPFSADDFEAVFAMQSDPDITRYLYWDRRTGPRRARRSR